MVVPGFGFSVGDFIAGGQLLVQVIGAFKEAGGASSKYATEVSFLNSLKSTLDHLERFVSDTSENSSQASELPQDISKLLQGIREPWEEFKKVLDKYEPSLGASSSRSKLAKAPRAIQYTVKDISGKVEKLRRQTEEPLQAINSLLSLHVIQSLEKLPGQLLQPAQCAQLVEAITLADIPTELDKQIRALRLVADEHNIKQDEQLQIITTLRAQLEDRIKSLQSVLDEVKGPDPIARVQHLEQLDASKAVNTRVHELSEVLESRADQLESAMKEQKQLMVALRSFLEDKTSRFESALEPGQQSGKENEKETSWPSATLSTAYFAALLLSSVLSSVAVTSIVTKNRSFRETVRPMWVPVDYSLPGLGQLNKIQVQTSLIRRMDDLNILSPALDKAFSTQTPPSNLNRGIQVSKLSIQEQPGRSTMGIITSTQAKPKDSISTKAADWVQDYTSPSTFKPRELQKSEQQPTTKIERRGMNVPYSTGPQWSKKISRLENPEHDGERNGDHGEGPDFGEPDAGFHNGLGPVVSTPSPVFRSPSPVHRESNPVSGRSPSPVSGRDWFRRSASPARRRSPSPVRHRSPSPPRSTRNGESSGWRSFHGGGGGGGRPASSSSSGGRSYGGGGGYGSDSS